MKTKLLIVGTIILSGVFYCWGFDANKRGGFDPLMIFWISGCLLLLEGFFGESDKDIK